MIDLIKHFKSELEKIKKIENIQIKYINGKLHYEIEAKHSELGYVVIKFSTILDISQIRFDDYGFVKSDVPEYIRAYIKNNIIPNDKNSLFSIEQIRRDMTIEEIEKELGYKINILNNIEEL